MTRLLHFALALFVCSTLPSCTTISKGVKKLPMPWKKKKKPEQTSSNTVQVVGIVEMVNPEQKFVLIRAQGNAHLAPGLELFAIDASGSQAKLKISPEKKLDLFTADIIDGTPRASNLVVFKSQSTPAPASDPNRPTQPSVPPLTPIRPPDQPPPLTPVTPSEFLKPGANLPVPSQPQSPSQPPIPPQPVTSPTPGGNIPVPGQIELPPVVR